MSDTTDFLIGVAEHLDSAGAGTWNVDGGYTSSDTPIVLTAFPSAPDRAIALTTYDVTNDPTFADSTIGIQVRTRGTKDPREVAAIDDATFDALQGLRGVELGGLRVLDMTRVSGSPMGADDNGRFERTANYYARVHRPAPHRD